MVSRLFASEGDGVYPRAAARQLSRPGKFAPSDVLLGVVSLENYVN